jgi:hypothetical protein
MPERETDGISPVSGNAKQNTQGDNIYFLGNIAKAASVHYYLVIFT